MASKALVANNTLILTTDNPITYDGALGSIKCYLPSGQTAGVEQRFTNDGDARLEICDFVGRRVFIMKPYSSLWVRKTALVDRHGVTISGYRVSDNLLDIKAQTPESHVVDLGVTDYTQTAASGTLSSGDSYTQADVEAALDGILDTLTGELDTESTTAFAAVETTLNAILASLTAQNITA
jgi:hypothetical protein